MVKCIAILLLLLSAAVLAIPGDLNADGTVSLPDLVLFADSWLTDDGGDLDGDNDTDFADFSILAANWTGDPNAPTATPCTSSPVSYIWQTITLTATDDGAPNPPSRLKYIISTLPAVGLLYDPKSGAGKIDKVPYSLSSWGTDVLYITDTAGNSSFGFKATDSGVSPTGGQSSEATVSITTAANPLDCLSFDGKGSVSIPDGTYLDVVDGWAIDFWIKTRQPYSTIIKKRSAGAGYEIKLVAGRPYIELYTAASKVGTLSGFVRIDDDAWHDVAFTVYSITGGSWRILYEQGAGLDIAEVDIAGAVPDMSNAEPVLIGNTYKGQFDRLRYFSGLDESKVGTMAGIIQGLFGRTELGEQVLGFGYLSSLFWMCDEHSGTTITDGKTSKVGTFSSADHVQWHPWIVPFVDVTVQGYSGGGR
jgi:hypothetical protein